MTDHQQDSSPVAVVSLPRNVSLGQIAMIVAMLVQVVAITAYIVSDSERQRQVEETLSGHVTQSQQTLMPQLNLILVELRGVNVRLDYLEKSLANHDDSTSQ